MPGTIYVNGRWIASASADTIAVLNPATEEVIDHVPRGGPPDVEAAVAAARDAFASWSRTPAEERCAYVRAVAASLAEHQDDLAELIATDVGCPLKIAHKVQVGLPVTVAGTFGDPALLPRAEELGHSHVLREPIGVVGAITAWNYPLYLIVAKVMPALAAGCTVVLKPSEVAPLAAYAFAEIVDAVGLPAGVFNMVSGTGPEVGEAVVAHPGVDMVSFTGSTQAGVRVSRVASDTVKRLTLELGGKSPCLILPDADLAAAVRATVSSAYLNGGQTCTALTRMLVHRDQQDDVLELVRAAARTYTVGDPFDPATRMGPMASGTHRDRVRGFIEKGIAEGATLVSGGLERPVGRDVGYYVQPTVFADVTPSMTLAQEEIFGPVLSVLGYQDEEDAIGIANDTRYGLTSAIWSGDTERALALARRIRAGQVDVNGGRFNPLAPFGGYRLSGNGRELGRVGLEEFFETKSIQLSAPR